MKKKKKGEMSFNMDDTMETSFEVNTVRSTLVTQLDTTFLEPAVVSPSIPIFPPEILLKLVILTQTAFFTENF